MNFQFFCFIPLPPRVIIGIAIVVGIAAIAFLKWYTGTNTSNNKVAREIKKQKNFVAKRNKEKSGK